MNDVLIVTPWLEGGGAQKALLGLINSRQDGQVFDLAILFEGSQHEEEITSRARRVYRFDQVRSANGAWKASLRLRKIIPGYVRLYSLMRGSHVVLGLLPHGSTAKLEMSASFHQLPSAEGGGIRAKVENVLVKRALRSAILVTAPSERAVEEIKKGKLAPVCRVRYEPNIVGANSESVVAPRIGPLPSVKLLFAGRLTKQKGLDQIPQILDGCTTPVDIRIVGDGSEHERLRDRLKVIKRPHTVSFIGRQNDVTSQLSWCDAAFMPSRAELKPVFAQEALAQGRIVVASRIAAFEDLAATDPVYLFSTPDEFKTIVSRIADDDEFRFEAYEKITRTENKPYQNRSFLSEALWGNQ